MMPSQITDLSPIWASLGTTNVFQIFSQRPLVCSSIGTETLEDLSLL